MGSEAATLYDFAVLDALWSGVVQSPAALQSFLLADGLGTLLDVLDCGAAALKPLLLTIIAGMRTWAARYYTGLLMKLTPKGVVLSFSSCWCAPRLVTRICSIQAPCLFCWLKHAAAAICCLSSCCPVVFCVLVTNFAVLLLPLCQCSVAAATVLLVDTQG